MVADMHGRRSRDIVDKAITALLNLEHRGAQGAEPNTGDGAGILLQVPDEFLRAVVDFDLPEPGSYATGIAFLPQSSKDAATACESVEKIVEAEGLDVLGWRDVPTDESSLGALARDAMPTFRQVFIGGASGMDLERRAYVVRKRAEHELGTKGPGQDGPGRETVYFPSLSGQTFVYKGMLTTPQLKAFYLDLQDERLTSALGIVHSRFSTNTFPSWPLAHPFRRIAHNGEINTVTGNENWMRAREALINTDVFGSDDDLDKIFPICTPGASDTARFDEVLELLHLGGRSLPHAVLMMIPEAWERHESMDPARRAFYQYHASLMEPWDGPASVCFTDGTVIGAVLDRNGLRPSRIWVTDDGLVVMASEAGVLDLDPSTVVQARCACSPAGCSWSTPRRAASSPTRRSRPSWPPSTRTRSGWTPACSTSTTCRRATTSACRTTGSCCASRPSATPTRSSTCWSRRWRAPAPRRSARWAPTPRSPCCRSGRGCSTTTSSSCSPRSPTRRWTPSAKRW